MQSPYQGIHPTIPDTCFIHSSAQIIGDVVLGEDVSVWCSTVIRGDVNCIRIGDGSNIQDLSMLHVSHKNAESPEGSPLIIGKNVTVGHQVLLHGCTISDECLIGMGSIVMDDVLIEPRVLIGAGSLVPQGKVLRSGYLYIGRPVKEIRPLTPKEIDHFLYSARHYIKLKNNYGAL